MSSDKFHIERSEVVYEGRMITAEMLDVRAPGGRMVKREIVRHPGAVAVVAVHNGCVVMVEQYRVALDDDLIEIPAGKLDVTGEPLADAARREMIEEVGLDPVDLIRLGSFVPAAGFCDEVLTIFACTECVEVERKVDGVEEEHSIVHHVPLAEVHEWIDDARLTDTKTLIGLHWARDRGLLDIVQ